MDSTVRPGLPGNRVGQGRVLGQMGPVQGLTRPPADRSNIHT